MKKIIFAILTLAVFSSCKKTGGTLSFDATGEISNSPLQDSIYKGSPVKAFGGKARVWVKLAKNGSPVKIAITLTNTVLTTVPFDPTEEEQEIVIPAPSQANVTAFHSFAIDWNPLGDSPKNIYGLALFGFHFFTITEAQKQAIIADPNYIQHYSTYPAPGYLPASYSTVSRGGIPGGGCRYCVHLYDTTAQEFHGQTFTQTFVYGTYNAKVNFYEPMMTLNFLQNTESFQRTIPQPSKFTPNGYYPTKMEVVKHAGSTDIILEGFKLRSAQ